MKPKKRKTAYKKKFFGETEYYEDSNGHVVMVVASNGTYNIRNSDIKKVLPINRFWRKKTGASTDLPHLYLLGKNQTND